MTSSSERDEYSRRTGTSRVARHPVAEHRAQGDDAGPAADQHERPAQRLLPHEEAADRAAQLELVAGAQHLDQVRRDLAVLEALDGQHEPLVLRGGGDRVAALRLVAVLGGQAHVDVLAGAVRPGQSGRSSTRLVARAVSGTSSTTRAELPGQSPW